jgi:hypothetical protein
MTCPHHPRNQEQKPVKIGEVFLVQSKSLTVAAILLSLVGSLPAAEQSPQQILGGTFYRYRY